MSSFFFFFFCLPFTDFDIFFPAALNETKLSTFFIFFSSEKIEAFLQREVSASVQERATSGEKGAFDTAIVPLVQIGSLGIRQDEDFTYRFLEVFNSQHNVYYLASGYFNLTPQYVQKIANSAATFKVLTASPRVRAAIFSFD